MRDKDEKPSLSDISVLRTAIGAGGLGGDDSVSKINNGIYTI
jgi:hypothetical protein